MQKFSLILYFFLLPGILLAKKYGFVQLTNNDGLSNSSINSISQNSGGLMWFGTWDGLNVYNGRQFNVYKPDPANPNSISNNIIRDVLEENENIQWIATDHGINRFDRNNHRFERYFVDSRSQSAYNEHSFLIAKNSSDMIIAAVYGQGIFVFAGKEKGFTRLNLKVNSRFKKIFFDLDDNLWIHTQEQLLFKVVFKKGFVESGSVQNVVQFQHAENIRAVFFDSSSNAIWMQTSDSRLATYNISAGVLNAYPGFSAVAGTVQSMLFLDERILLGTEKGLFECASDRRQMELLLNNVSVLSLFKGTQQIIWVGTDMQGVWMLTPPREKFRTVSAENVTDFGNSAVRTFNIGTDGRLWVGTKGSGIYVFAPDKEADAPVVENRFSTSNGLLNNSVFTIVAGPGGEKWIGTDGNGINYTDLRTGKLNKLQIADSLKPSINLSSVYALFFSSDTVLWVGTSGYGLYGLHIDRTKVPYSIRSYRQYIYKAHQPHSLSNNIVYSILRDDEKHLWIATRGGGLNRFDMQSGNFTTYRTDPGNSSSISSNDILCLHRDAKGDLWAGTSVGLNKLVRIVGGNPEFQRFTEKEGMPNNTIHGILEDSDRNIWVSTNQGIAKLIHQQEKYRIVSYFKKDGLQNNEFSDGSFYKRSDTGEMYFGGISGFNVFNPGEITHSNFMPSLILDAFFIDNTEMNLSSFIRQDKEEEVLVLSYKNKSFSFRFIPLDYLAGTKCEIAYILEGYQKEWIQLGTSSAIVFSNLPKGDYVLKVKWSNADKLWSEEYFELPVRIRPAWWDTTWAYGVYIVLFLFFTFGLYRFLRFQIRVRNDIRLKELEKQKNEEVHQAKLRFFTNIAHEFSNSLTLIYGPCEQLLRTTIPDSLTRKYINIIKSNSERMQGLIQQLIEFRKAETGHLQVRIEKTDVAELIRFVLDNFQEVLEQKNIKLILNIHPDLLYWNSDRDSLEKILFNLVSNAVKYTPSDEKIEVSASYLSEPNIVQIQVTNRGVGIKEDHHRRIFDRFEVLERFEKQVMKGLETSNGIGLALCKNLVELLGGTIRLESDGETYTSFTIRLPELAPDTDAAPLPNEPVRLKTTDATGYPPESEARQREIMIPDTVKNGLILVVDDDPEICRLLHDILIHTYEIAMAYNGKEAIEMMKLRLPVLIITDNIMPVMDGVELVKIMKQQELTRHIPILMLSTKSSVESQIEGLEMGADGYLGKPFHPRHLEAMVESALSRNKTLLDYSESPYLAVDLLEGKIIRKEDRNLILRITSLIFEQIENDSLSIEYIAGELAMSKMQLYRKLKENVGQTPTEYIRTIRLKQAEKLLKTTSKTVSEIMYLCGFNNKAYFYREFAKKFNDTPKEFRKKAGTIVNE